MNEAGIWRVHCARCGIAISTSVKPNDGEVFTHDTCPAGLAPPALTAETVTRIAQAVAEPCWQAIRRQADLMERMIVALEQQSAIMEKLLR
jgi:hypothetical protein